MKTLVLMRGAPGAGKSSFIREHGLEPYTLSADQIRLQYCSPVLDNNGCITTSQKNDKIVWENLFKMLEYRMQLGCFTVIDATNSKTAEMKRYKDICSKYRYRILLVDMTDVPLEVCKERNRNREEYKRVPEQALENIYSRFATQGVPSGIKVVKPQDFDNEILFKPIDLSEYDNIYVIGDIHGVYNVLQDFVNDVSKNSNTNKPYLTDRWLNIEDFPKEQWKDIDGYDGNYQISNYGRLKSIQRDNKNQLTNEDKICKVRENTYLYFNLSLNSQKKTCKIHQLVMEYFGSEKPFDNAEINHKDGNKLNNHIDNLEWSTRQKNEQHAWNTQLKDFSQSVKQFDINGTLLKEYPSIKVASESLNIISTSIVKCCSGQIKTAGGYKWEYNIPKELHRAGISMAIDQFDLEGHFLCAYKSIHEAERAVGVQSIRQVLAGKAKTAGGYCWKYHDTNLNIEELVLNSPNNFFIFCGDYTDRGTQNAEVLNFLYRVKDKDNVLLLEGNHDSYWNKWGNDDVESIRSKEFLRYTKAELENKDIFTKKMARELYRKLSQCAYFIYNGHKYFCCHGGLSSMPDNLMFVPTAQMINGVGRHSDYKEISESFAEQYVRNFNQSNSIVMISGHRNVQKYGIKVNDYCYNLEGAVEFNGNLRVVRIGKNNTITPYEYKNDLPIAEHLIETKTQFTSSEDNVIINDNTDIKNIVTALRDNKHVIEKKFGNVSSFNFSREAFEKGIWDHMTVKARGLYIDTIKNKILARGYEKFFRLFEVEQTKPDNLARTLKFPLVVYKKENGYLGLIAYNEYTDDLFFTTKSNPDGDYARHFKELFNKLVSTDKKEKLKNILKEKDVTLAVEVVDPIFDPHIIKYDKANIYCLDLIKNTIDFEVEGYYELNRVSDLIGLPCKERVAIIKDWNEFEKFYTNAPADPTYYSGSTVHVEGWVIEDADGYMFKIKSDFYNTWKKLRGVANSVIKSGNYKYTGSLQTPMENYFYAWLKENWQIYHYNDTLPRDIISLREDFYKSEYFKTLKVSK